MSDNELVRKMIDNMREDLIFTKSLIDKFENQLIYIEKILQEAQHERSIN